MGLISTQSQQFHLLLCANGEQFGRKRVTFHPKRCQNGNLCSVEIMGIHKFEHGETIRCMLVEQCRSLGDIMVCAKHCH